MKASAAVLIMLPLVVVVAAFVLVAYRGAGADTAADGVYWDDQVVQFVRRRIAFNYVDELDSERSAQAFYAAMDGYVRDLDPYCDFIPPEEHKRWRENTSGRYAGLGIKVQESPEGVLIVGVFPEGPADRAGLQRGETILAVDGVDLAGQNLPYIEQTGLLKGEAGSRVQLTVQPARLVPAGDPVGVPRQVEVERAVIRTPSVYARRVGEQLQVGVVRIREFADASEEAFGEALDALIEEGVEGLVLDLRGNPGGVLPAAVGIADRFLRRGVIVRMEGRATNANRTYEAKADNAVSDTLPLVVLVDRGSASASEVVAGALQDHRRALLVGERTYGKFLVQQITDVPGYEAALQLTTSRYYLPSGRSYQRTSANGHGGRADGGAAGILPDVLLALSETERDRLKKGRANEEARPWGEAVPYPEVAEDWVDAQLGRALELLDGQLILRRIRGKAPSRPQ